MNQVLLTIARACVAATMPLCSTSAIAGPVNDLNARLLVHTQSLVNAVAPGDVGPWHRLADDGLVYITESGEVLSKSQFLAELSPLPRGLSGKMRVTDFALRRYGDTALTHYVLEEALDYHGQSLQTRFLSSDVWVRRQGQWRIVAMHVTVLLRDPPALKPTSDALAEYVGRYRLTSDIHYLIRIDTISGVPRLLGRRGDGPESALSMEVSDVFFIPGKPRSRKVFYRDSCGRITGFGDRREGQDIVWVRERSQKTDVCDG